MKHEQALGRMITVAAKTLEQEGIAEDGYRFNHEYQPSWGPEVYCVSMRILTGRMPVRPDAGA